MATLTNRIFSHIAKDIDFLKDMLVVFLKDGRKIEIPLDYFPTLRDASPKQRKNWRLVGGGIGIHWEDLDEDISVENLLH